MSTLTWFYRPERVNALERAAQSWLGTPFGANAKVKGPGGGVSCQMLACEILTEVGCIKDECPPPAMMSWARHQRESLIVPYMDGHPRFARLDPSEPLLPGDVLGFKIQSCVHHMGVVLPAKRFAHVWMQTGVLISLLTDPTYSKRLAMSWRPKP